MKHLFETPTVVSDNLSVGSLIVVVTIVVIVFTAIITHIVKQNRKLYKHA